MSRHKVTAPGGRCVGVGAQVRFEARTWQVTGLVEGRGYLAADGFEVLGQATLQVPAASVWAALQLLVRERAMAWWDAQAQAEQW